MNSAEIVGRAMALQLYKYWYGGSGQIATRELADQLKAAYTSVWTQAYYNTALLDIDGHNRVADCSWLVSYAYDLGYHCGTAQMHDVFDTWLLDAVDGMITWRKGHCGIYNKGNVIQMANQARDFQILPYRRGDWIDILYDPNVDYDEPTPPTPPGPDPPPPGPTPGGPLPIWMLFKLTRRL